MIKKVETNECQVIVEPRYIGIESIPGEAFRNCANIQKDIERHVDDVESIYIKQKYVYETKGGSQHDTLYDALGYLFDEIGGCLPVYRYRYERPEDKGTGSVGGVYDFRDLIETAWENPWNFTVKGTPLTESQTKFLGRVLEAALEEKQGLIHRYGGMKG